MLQYEYFWKEKHTTANIYSILPYACTAIIALKIGGKYLILYSILLIRYRKTMWLFFIRGEGKYYFSIQNFEYETDKWTVTVQFD